MAQMREYGEVVTGYPEGFHVAEQMGYELSIKAGWLGRAVWAAMLKMGVVHPRMGVVTVYRYRQLFRGSQSELRPFIQKIA
jgi:hypothetical protein